MSLRFYPKTFVNPLLAIAFKEGVDFVGDPDYRVSEPKQENDRWVVIVEHDDDDDDEPVKPLLTKHDYEDRLKHMIPVIAKSAPPEVIHLPVKISSEPPEFLSDTSDTTQPCGECMACKQGQKQDCLQIINNACIMSDRMLGYKK